MSTGGSIPYDLRPKKAVDRFVFLDLLSKINSVKAISNYEYIGFAGHSFEEYKILHSQFNIQKMVSLESDENVLKRQLFNRPFSCIDCTLKNSSEYINQLSTEDRDPNNNLIIWFDYTKPQIKTNLDEIQGLIRYLIPGDILRVTLNANPDFLGNNNPSNEPGKQSLHEYRLERLTEMVGVPATVNLDESHLIAANFQTSICEVLRYYIQQVTTDIHFQLLCCLSYQDGQKMLTVTGMFFENQQKASEFLTHSGLPSWNLFSENWSNIFDIDIPDMTLRERLFINSLLPSANPQEIELKLGFKYEKNSQNNIKKLKNYADFYRYVTHFGKIVV